MLYCCIAPCVSCINPCIWACSRCRCFTTPSISVSSSRSGAAAEPHQTAPFAAAAAPPAAAEPCPTAAPGAPAKSLAGAASALPEHAASFAHRTAGGAQLVPGAAVLGAPSDAAGPCAGFSSQVRASSQLGLRALPGLDLSAVLVAVPPSASAASAASSAASFLPFLAPLGLRGFSFFLAAASWTPPSSGTHTALVRSSRRMLRSITRSAAGASSGASSGAAADMAAGAGAGAGAGAPFGTGAAFFLPLPASAATASRLGAFPVGLPSREADPAGPIPSYLLKPCGLVGRGGGRGLGLLHGGGLALVAHLLLRGLGSRRGLTLLAVRVEAQVARDGDARAEALALGVGVRAVELAPEHAPLAQLDEVLPRRAAAQLGEILREHGELVLLAALLLATRLLGLLFALGLGPGLGCPPLGGLLAVALQLPAAVVPAVPAAARTTIAAAAAAAAA
eukprot:scaffold32430_cov63-Phaeocystis_antarctica.AAC.1